MRSLAVLICCAPLLLAQSGTEPKPKPEDYECHSKTDRLGIGAEFMIHSFSGEAQTYIADDFLIVEVALYPAKEESVTVRGGEFMLRVNGKKQIPQAPSSWVVASLHHSDWQTGPRAQGSIGMGNTDVILGRPRPTQIPGQSDPRTPPRPAPPDDHGVTPEPKITAEDLCVKAALQEGTYGGAVSGYLYFPWKGKTSSIKSVELLYQGLTLKLR